MTTEQRIQTLELLAQTKALRDQIQSRPVNQQTPRLSICIRDIARMEQELAS